MKKMGLTNSVLVLGLAVGLQACLQNAGSTLSAASSGLSVGSPANGLSASGTTISIATAGASQTGALSSTDWSNFNAAAISAPTFSGQVLTSSTAGTRSWNTVGGIATAGGSWSMFEEFMFPGAAATGSLMGGHFVMTHGGTAGVQCVAAAGSVSHPGVLACDVGTDAAGRVAVHGAVNGILLGGGALTWTAVVNVPVLSTGAETFHLTVGLGDTLASDVASPYHTDGVYFAYNEAVNGGRWQCESVSNGTGSTADSGITVAAATFYKLAIAVDATAANATCYVNDVSVGTLTTNIPSGAGRQTGVIFKAEKSNGTTATVAEIDYMAVSQTLTTAR